MTQNNEFKREGKMSPDWKEELDKFGSSNNEQKLKWLASTLNFVSKFARSTYSPGSDGVDDPVALRKYNELIDRISEQQLMTLIPEISQRPDQVFFQMVYEMTKDLGIGSTLLSRLRRSIC